MAGRVRAGNESSHALQRVTTRLANSRACHVLVIVRDESARAHLYKPAQAREHLQADAAEDLLERVFGGSAAELMQRALSRRKPKRAELKELRRMIDDWEAKKK